MSARAEPRTGVRRGGGGTGPRAPIALRLAWRDLRGGLGGYWIFLVCIALGVAAIAGVGSVAGSLSDGLGREGRTMLGGDAAFSTVSQPLGAPERDWLAARGRSSQVVTTRSMARAGDQAGLVDVKAVDGAYPTAGAVALDPPQPLDAALALRDGRQGLAADAALADRLGVKVGDAVKIGAGDFTLRAIIRSEPDRLAGGIAFAPGVLMSRAGLDATGLIQPGSLAKFTTRLALTGAADDATLGRLVADARAAFPEAGWEIKTRNNVSPEFDRNLGRFTQFLTLIGLTALVVGGVGVANAVKAAMERKRASLAVLKALGAPGGSVFAMGLAQVMLVALFGVLAGVVIGAALPYAAVAGFGAVIPLPMVAGIHPASLGLGALYGFLTALVFSLPTLGRVHDVPVSALFRDAVEPDPGRLRLGYRLALLAAVAALAACAIGFSEDHRLAAYDVGATLLVFAALRLVAWGFMAAARALPRPRNVELRLALGNIHRPGALTSAVVLSLGLGLTLLVTLALIDANIQRQITEARPGVTPSFFFADVPNREAEGFLGFIRQRAPAAVLEDVPILRGRITAVDGVPADRVHAKQGATWVLEGDRGITFADEAPKGSRVVSGSWWPKDYAGVPLVSFDRELADGIGLKLGDSVTVNVLGRPVTATVANFRKVDWQNLGINFVMVFSPNAFRGAPYMELATAGFPTDDPARDTALARDIAQSYPAVTTVRVRDVLEAVNAFVGKLGTATRAASAVTILSSVLVLAGALAAGRRARVYDAVMLKVLGATRRRLLIAFVLEYGILGLGTALFGVLAGTAAAWGVVSHVMGFDFAFAWAPAIEAALAALVVTVGLGLAGTWRILGQKPAGYLRSL